MIARAMKLTMLSSLLVFNLSTNAAIIDNGGYTTDTVSGLDWLDVTATINMSYNDVMSNINLNGFLLGWRYATRNELDGLVYNFTSITPDPTIPQNTIISNFPEGDIESLVNLLGDTLESYWISAYGDTYNNWNNLPVGTGYGYTFGIIPDSSVFYRSLLNYSSIPLPAGYLQNYGFYNAAYQEVTSTYQGVSVGS